MGKREPSAGTPDGRSSGTRFAARISVFALVLSALWTPLNVLLLPNRIDATAPQALRSTALGIVTVLGIGLAVIVEPIAGRASDHASLRDRRRPFIAYPAVVAIAALALVGWSPAFLVLLAGYVLLQLAMNVAQAAFQGLIPDLVPEEARGRASGVKTAFDVGGMVLGLVVVGGILAFDWPGVVAYGAIALILLAGALSARVQVPPVPPLPEGERLSGWRAALSLDALRDAFARFAAAPSAFRHAVFMRFVFLLGVYVLQRFLLFFLEDRFGITDAGGLTAAAIVGALAIGGTAAFVAGRLADHAGAGLVARVVIVLGAAGLAGAAVAPDKPVLMAAGALLAVGVGGFQAVNWTMLARAMPDENSAQFFGLANIATAGAGACAGILGPVVDLGRDRDPSVAYGIAFLVAALVTLSSLLLVTGAAAGEQRHRAPASSTGAGAG